MKGKIKQSIQSLSVVQIVANENWYTGKRNSKRFFPRCFSLEKIWNFNTLTTPCVNASGEACYTGCSETTQWMYQLFPGVSDALIAKHYPLFLFFFFLTRTRTETRSISFFFFFFNYIIANSLSVKIYSTKFSRKFFGFKRNVIFHEKKRLQTIFISILPIHYWQIYLNREWHEIGVMDCSSK